MSKKKQQDTLLDKEIDLQESYSKAENFINDNKGLVLGIAALILIGLIAYFGFNNIYLAGQEKDAQASMYKAQQYFAKDSFNLALNGDGNHLGFLDVIDEYSGMTKSAKLANYYAGVSYLNMGNYEDAIKYLSNFSSDDIMVSTMAIGAMGDAYMELGQNDKGISQYKKAANNSKNEFTAPLFLMKAAMALEAEGKFKDAKGYYDRIKADFPKSTQASDIDKYIARVAAKI